MFVFLLTPFDTVIISNQISAWCGLQSVKKHVKFCYVIY